MATTTTVGTDPIPTSEDAETDESIAYLFRRLTAVEARVRGAVERRRIVDPDPDDRFRGLYISEAHVQHLLSDAKPARELRSPDAETSDFLVRIETAADSSEKAGVDIRLRRLARTFGLSEIDVEILLIALAPDVDPRFERLYAYLNDDVSRRRATTGLCLDLCDVPLGSGTARARFNADAPLVSAGLLLVEEADRPFLTRALRVPDRIIAHLLGDDAPDVSVSWVLTSSVITDFPMAGGIAQAMRDGVRLFYVRERPGGAGFSLAATAFAVAGLPSMALDLSGLETSDDVKELATSAAREARLRGGGLVVGPIETLAERGTAAIRTFAESSMPVVMVGARGWDPIWTRAVPLLLDAPTPAPELRGTLWKEALDGHLEDGIDPALATAQFRLTPEQVQRAARAAHQMARASARKVLVEDLHAGARAQNAAGLDRLARRIEPRVGWGDLVLPRAALDQLRELTARVRHRDMVLDSWGIGRRSSRGRGISALFAGESGTGKTMSAEVVAGGLGLDLYVIDLSTVIDKYVGETEKNLERIFVEADRVNGVLLFDEADAIFGKRSEVRDAHDRYANVEIAYLLSRMERFDGLAILTTNLRSNIDDAFARRLDAIVDFPMPDPEHRRDLWRLNVEGGAPLGDDIDLDFLSEAFRVSGGNIRNVSVAAAYMAAEEGTPVGMSHLIRATEREYRKLGHLCVEDEFGPYFNLIER